MWEMNEQVKVILMFLFFMSGCAKLSPFNSGNPTLDSTERAEAHCANKGGLAYFSIYYVARRKDGSEVR